jgi:hypothetical protein
VTLESLVSDSQWRTFQVQGVKRKGRASLELKTGVGNIVSVPSPNGEAKRDFEFIEKTDSWSHYGEKRKSETSYNGGILRMKRKGC